MSNSVAVAGHCYRISDEHVPAFDKRYGRGTCSGPFGLMVIVDFLAPAVPKLQTAAGGMIEFHESYLDLVGPLGYPDESLIPEAGA